MTDTIDWPDFERVALHAGTIIKAEVFPEARKPAYKLSIDFGDEIGKRASSAQITDLYTCADLVGKQVLCVINFPSKQIGPFVSECLVTGFHRDDGAVALCVPDSNVPNGARLA